MVIGFFIVILYRKNYLKNVLGYGCKNKERKRKKKASALKREHPAIQKIKFINFFQFFKVIFALLDPDPDPQHWPSYWSLSHARCDILFAPGCLLSAQQCTKSLPLALVDYTTSCHFDCEPKKTMGWV